MFKLTLDTNCLIDIENNREQYKELNELLSLNNNEVDIYISAISASENQKGDRLINNYEEYSRYTERIGCGNCKILYPMCYMGVGFIGVCVVSDETLESLERSIHSILFPNYPFKYAECFAILKSEIMKRGQNISAEMVDIKAKSKWRRMKCDVQAMWCHIYYKNDVFITRDAKAFHNVEKKQALIDLGAKNIMYPNDCLAYVQSMRNGSTII